MNKCFDQSRRPILSLPQPRRPFNEKWLNDMCRPFQSPQPSQIARKNGPRGCRIAALNLIVHISPELEPDPPLPPPWALSQNDSALYFLSQNTTQPIVWNGFVWSYKGDGSQHRVQHFVEGVDVLGGKPLHVENGKVFWHNADGSAVVLLYHHGRCLSVCTPRSPEPH